MEQDHIAQRIGNLPTLAPGPETIAGGEIWEGDDGNAHFEVARIALPNVRPIDLVTLRVSGPLLDRLRVFTDFSRLLGEPSESLLTNEPSGTDFAAWTLMPPPDS